MNQLFDFQKERQDSEIFIPYKDDYKSILDYLNIAEQRVTNLGAVVNSAISLENALNTSKLTALASAFLPPSLLAGVLSMNTEPLSGIYNALSWWAVISGASILTIFGLYYFTNKDNLELWKRRAKQMNKDRRDKFNQLFLQHLSRNGRSGEVCERV